MVLPKLNNMYRASELFRTPKTEARPSLLKAHDIGSRIIQKMKDFVEVFIMGMTG